MVARLVAAALLCLALAAPSAAAVRPVGGAAPTGLKAFLLRADEPARTAFARTPSFAWNPVPGAVRYEFQLSTSNVFRENGILFSESQLTSPAVSVPLTLPWITGSPYSLYARVRAVLDRTITPWSRPFGFNMRWDSLPTPLPTYPGLLRWTPVEGAAAYQVWFPDVGKVVAVHTNVVDQRELYTFHQGTEWTSNVRWRVRAVRWVLNDAVNGLPANFYGPWSPVYTSVNPPLSLGPLAPLATASDVVSLGRSSDPAHRLMPGFAFAGSQTFFGLSTELYRVYVFTDRQCLNPVFKGAVVGSPAYAPRPYGPLELPRTPETLAAAPGLYLASGDEGAQWSADYHPVKTTESQEEAKPTTTLPPADTSASGAAPSGRFPSAPPAITIKPGTTLGAPVDLWDTGWPRGGYYWTVVSVVAVQTAAGSIEYRELELPQDACAAGRVTRFGKTSQPALTRASAPFASGLSPSGRLVSASTPAPRFYGTPHVAWTPVLGADAYEVQWSKTRYPFRPETDPRTNTRGMLVVETSALMPLTPGTWWYRVRGLNYRLPTGAQQLSWSATARVVVAKPQFRVVRSGR